MEGVMNKRSEWKIGESSSNYNWFCYVHLRTNTFRWGMNKFILLCVGIFIFLKDIIIFKKKSYNSELLYGFK